MTSHQHANASDLPVLAGIGLRSAHAREILARSPALGFLEIHSENYFSDGPQIDLLRQLRQCYPISAHGVGLSLGSADGVSTTHLAALARLVDWLEPVFVSEHLAWGAIDGLHTNDLLPLPYINEALERTVSAVQQVQDALRRKILIENVSSYIAFERNDMQEWEFLRELASRSGCGILLDVNNIDVSARNHGFDPYAYIDAIPPAYVEELHVAGHSVQRFGEQEIVVDTHDQRVSASGWCLLRHALKHCGPVPVLVEWDSALPPLQTLLNEAHLANACSAVHAHAA
jgi:uncharacterized protein